MSCEHCVGHVKEALEGLDKVTSVEAGLENNCAIFETTNSDEELKAAIEEEGYDVVKIEE
ncbi:heavy metal transport/detoxification protein [Clostridium beijerinckii]|nr:heavy metal transport/detoxification protein [Clostridium beijerinckii]